MLLKLAAAHEAGRFTFHGADAGLAERRAFMRYLSPLRRRRWFVYCKPPFARPKTVKTAHPQKYPLLRLASPATHGAFVQAPEWP
jgi:hypothetical protein